MSQRPTSKQQSKPVSSSPAHSTPLPTEANAKRVQGPSKRQRASKSNSSPVGNDVKLKVLKYAEVQEAKQHEKDQVKQRLHVHAYSGRGIVHGGATMEPPLRAKWKKNASNFNKDETIIVISHESHDTTTTSGTVYVVSNTSNTSVSNYTMSSSNVSNTSSVSVTSTPSTTSTTPTNIPSSPASTCSSSQSTCIPSTSHVASTVTTAVNAPGNTVTNITPVTVPGVSSTGSTNTTTASTGTSKGDTGPTDMETAPVFVSSQMNVSVSTSMTGNAVFSPTRSTVSSAVIAGIKRKVRSPTSSSPIIKLSKVSTDTLGMKNTPSSTSTSTGLTAGGTVSGSGATGSSMSCGTGGASNAMGPVSSTNVSGSKASNSKGSVSRGGMTAKVQVSESMRTHTCIICTYSSAPLIIVILAFDN